MCSKFKTVIYYQKKIKSATNKRFNINSLLKSQSEKNPLWRNEKIDLTVTPSL